jgi:AraC-like DNA-binding protein
MLTSQQLLGGDRVQISNVACRHHRGRGLEEEPTTGGHWIVFVRRGCFVRSVNGVASVLDPTLAYCMNPGDEQRYDHPHDGGDDCTSIFLCADLAASVWGGEPQLPTEPLVVTPQLDLGHRLLLGAIRQGADEDMGERAISLAASALATIDPRRVTSGRPGTERARRALTEAAREMLAHDPQTSLPELARSLTVSPHHLSRVFRAITGRSISRHRMRLRARAALERLAGGEQDLARLAADVGFADQSHLCRVIRQETGSSPSALRRNLA